MPDRDLVKRIADGEERPCIQMMADDLLRHAQTNWDDVFCLYQIVAEARIRVWKRPNSRAKKILQKVRPQLELLCGATFPDDPNPEPGPGPFPDSSSWPKVGVLKHMGYTAGREGPAEPARRKILRQCFQGPIPNVHDPYYMKGWGRDRTLIRLSKMAWSLASFASNRIRMNAGLIDDASRLWKEDLKWLRKEFYEDHFHFPWPSLS
jgi:hypothetical protein